MSYMHHDFTDVHSGEVQELTLDELSQVHAGWAWAVVGGIAGGLQQYAERSDDGDMSASDWAGVAGGAALGAIGGRAIMGGGGNRLSAYLKQWVKKK